jgi:hypothetical protein
MRHPRLIILESDGWLARQFTVLAGEARWLVHTSPTPATSPPTCR